MTTKEKILELLKDETERNKMPEDFLKDNNLDLTILELANLIREYVEKERKGERMRGNLGVWMERKTTIWQTKNQ